MTIAKFNERELLALGMDRQTVAALRHVIAQTGNEVGARTLPYVATQAEQIPVLADQMAAQIAQGQELSDAVDAQTVQIQSLADIVAALGAPLRATLLADAVAGNSAANIPLVSLTIPKPLTAGAMISGRVVGVTSNGNIPGVLNLWLSVAGVKVFSHAFTTPDVIGAGKGFDADFTLTVRSVGNAAAGGVLSLAYNAPTVLPSSATFAIPTGANTVFALGMNWTAANAANIATARLAYLTADKL